MKAFEAKAGANGNATFIIPTSDTVDARVLAADVAETHTVPAGARFVLFSADGDFWVNFNGGTAVVPTGDVTNGSASELNPTARTVKAGDTFSIVAGAARLVSMAFYK